MANALGEGIRPNDMRRRAKSPEPPENQAVPGHERGVKSHPDGIRRSRGEAQKPSAGLQSYPPAMKSIEDARRGVSRQQNILTTFRGRERSDQRKDA